MKKIAWFLNPSAGGGKSLKKKKIVERALRSRGLDFDLFISESEAHLIELTQKWAPRYEILIAAGGDTTFNLMVTELMTHPPAQLPALGFIGTGSANDLVQGLKIARIGAACNAIKKNQVQMMDIGLIKIASESTPHYFLGSMSLGLGLTVNRYVESFTNRHPKLPNLTLIRQTIPGLMGIRHSFQSGQVPIKASLVSENLRLETQASLLVFSNTSVYANGLSLNPQANAFDGKLDCCICMSDSFIETIRSGLHVQNGSHTSHSCFQFLISSKFQVTTDQPLEVQADGKIISAGNQFEVSLLPKSLKILI